MDEFTGWPAAATAFLTEIAADNTQEFWAEHRHRHDAVVQRPMRALAAALEPEFGPVRIFRPLVNRRFRPDAPPCRTDTGGAATTERGSTYSVVLSATTLTVSAGRWAFVGEELRRYRAAVDGPAGERLAALLAALDRLEPSVERDLVGIPQGFRADHPRIALLRHRGLQVTASWPVGEWIGTPEPLARVRTAWRAAAPLVAWLDEHVGPAANVLVAARPERAGTGQPAGGS